MRAIHLHEFGPPENLRLEEVADPVPGEGQVRIAVEAAGVHVLDTYIRSGASGGPFPLPALPTIPGREVAGVVDALGPSTERGLLGRRVVAHLGMASAGYATSAVAAQASLHVVPDHLGSDVAVAMIGTGRTAAAVLRTAALAADDVALIPAAAGGLGNLFVQEATHVGAVAVGLAGGPEKAAAVLAVGGDVAIDYSDPRWPELVRDALGDRELTVVLDGVGGDDGRRTFDLLGPGGRHVIFGFTAGVPTQITTADLLGRGLTVTSALGPALIRRPGALREFESTALARAADGICSR